MKYKNFHLSYVFILATMLTTESYGEDWGGIYMGGNVSVGSGNITGKDAAISDPITLPVSGNLYGLHFGYNHDFNQIVAGVELSIMAGAYEFDREDFSGTHTGTTVEGFKDAKLKIGYDAGKVMPYLVGGFSSAYGTDAGSSKSSLTFKGYAKGAGIEYLLNENIILGLEYYSRTLEGESKNSNFTQKLNDTTLRVSYRF